MAHTTKPVYFSRSTDMGKKLEGREYRLKHALMYFYQDETKFVSFAAIMAIFHLRGRFK